MYENYLNPTGPTPNATTYTGSTQSFPAPPPTMPIVGTVQALEKHISHLHEMLASLEQRLEPVLTPTIPTPASTQPNAAGTVQAGSAHQMTLANLGFAVMQSVERLNRLLGRLEI